MTPADQIAALKAQIVALEKRCDIQQQIIDAMRRPEAPTAVQMADAIFERLTGKGRK